MKDPAFLFYPNDYIGGTMGMTFEEKGAYIELLMLQFNRGHMTSQMVGQTVGQIWLKIQDKFKIDTSGLFYNERLDIEIEKRRSFVQSRNNNLSGKNQYSKKEGHKGGHMTSHMEDVNVDVIVNEEEDKNKKLKIPEKHEMIEYFEKNGYKRDAAITAYNWYDSHDWSDRNGEPVINWKNKSRQVWFKPENKRQLA